MAPLFRTANRSPTSPLMKTSPAVAPYSSVLPAMTLCRASNFALGGVLNTIRPPESPLPR